MLGFRPLLKLCHQRDAMRRWMARHIMIQSSISNAIRLSLEKGRSLAICSNTIEMDSQYHKLQLAFVQSSCIGDGSPHHHAISAVGGL